MAPGDQRPGRADPARDQQRALEVQGTSGIATATQTEIALLRNPIAHDLGELAGEPVEGLLGYSFLRRFRIACDYPHRVLWLDPVVGFKDPHPYEHSHVGLQLERDRGAVRVVSVIEGSPAAQAGIAAGDVVTAVNGKSLHDASWDEIGTMMEGPPGSSIDLTIRRGSSEATHHLRRRRLL